MLSLCSSHPSPEERRCRHVEACYFFEAPPWCDAWAAVQHTDGSSVSICRTPAQARACFEVNTSTTTWQQGRKARPLREKERKKMSDMVKGCWMVLHTDIQMNNEKGRVVLLSMQDIFWGNISLLVKEMMWQKSEGKGVESFASYVRYFKKKR